MSGGVFLSVENCKSAFTNHRIGDESVSVKILFLHIDPDDGEIVVGFIIINAFFRITAGRIGCKFKISVQINAALLLFDRSKDMKKLSDIVRLIAPFESVRFREGGSDETGRR